MTAPNVTKSILEVQVSGLNRVIYKAINQINELSIGIIETGDSIQEIASGVEAIVEEASTFINMFNINNPIQDDILMFDSGKFTNHTPTRLLDGGNF